MSKFKVGDRVIVNGLITDIEFINEKGTIISNLKYLTDTYAIKFDIPRFYFHSCNGLCKVGYGFYIHTPHISLIIPYKKIIQRIIDEKL